jgi:hypothetical protein
MSKKFKDNALSKLIIKLEGGIYRVYSLEPFQRKFEIGSAYYNACGFDPYVYPYRGKIDKYDEAKEVGVYLLRTEDKKRVIYVQPDNEKEKSKYHNRRIKVLSPDIIFEHFADDISESDNIILNTDGNVFTPSINPDDDINMKLIKYALYKKQIDFNGYAKRFDDVNDKNNHRKLLLNNNKLSLDKLMKLCEVFDIDFGILFWDRPNASSPMSNDNNAFMLYNNGEFDVVQPNIEIIEDMDVLLNKGM